MATLGKGFQNRSHADSEEEAGEAKAVLRPDARKLAGVTTDVVGRETTVFGALSCLSVAIH
jgi:hypothetical protein